MEYPVRNIADLKSEIFRLRGLEQEQGAALRQRFNSPSAIFSSIYSIFKAPEGNDSAENKGRSFFSQDIVAMLSRIVVPFTLNKTLFRNSNFIVKTLVGLVSQKASKFITEDSVVSVWDKVKSFIPGMHKHKAEPEHRNADILA